MSLSKVVADLKKSEIYTLKYSGQVLGFRVKLFNVDTREFDYYDFNKSIVAGSQELKDYINNNHKNFSVLALREHNGLAMSDDEISGKIEVKNFKDTKMAEEIIGKVVKINQLGDQI